MQVTLRSARGRWILAATILASGVAFLDSTVVNIALEAIRADLDAPFAWQQWVVVSYALTLGALVLVGGDLGDRRGHRRIFLAGAVGFALTSLAAGLAPNIEILVATRAAQGVAAALMTPTSLSLIQSSFTKEDRPAAIGVWSGVSGLATIAGPFLGGWLIDVASWRAIFLINPPLLAATVWITLRHVPADDHDGSRSIDWAGGLLAASGLGGWVYALIESGRLGWSHWSVVTGMVVGSVSAVAFIVVEEREAHPMLPLSFFRNRRFAGTNAATFFIYFALSAAGFLIVLQLIGALGYSELEGGAALVPITVLLFVMSPWAGRLAVRFGPGPLMTIGPLLAAGGMGLAVRITPGATFMGAVLPSMVLFGIGLGLTVAPLTATALAALPESHAGTASGVNNAVARVGGLLAVALLPVVAGLSGVEGAGAEGFTAGFQRAMWIGAGLLALGGVISFATVRGAVDLGDQG